MKVPHDSAHGHVTGESIYVDDRPFVSGEVFVDIFYSEHAAAKIKKIDIEMALKDPLILSIYKAEDLRLNQWGSIFKDQPFLAKDEVQYVGEPILIIAGETLEACKSAKKKIKIEYEILQPVLGIDQAIKKKALIGPQRKIQRGNAREALSKSKYTIKNTIEMQGQDHFYLESQACIAYPMENECIEIHSSSQHPSEVQHLVAEALGIKFHQVVCIVKRMGGGFGGKESQAALFAVYASLVAFKLKRPARLVLTKDDDMLITGKRNPFKNFYEVGFNEKGKITALEAYLFSDGGAYADLSTAIMERAMLHLDNAYNIADFFVQGQVCKTNTPPNTAFRGFGGPKGVITIESIIEEISEFLKLDALEVRKRNLYKKGDKTPYGQLIDDNILPELFSKVTTNSQYKEWREKINQYNSKKLTSFKGLSATAVKFGISFTTRFLNQGNALVNIHLDGTIQVSTGATEMGQGVNTKIAQIVADCFSIPASDVKIMPTSTEKNPNTSATAASSGSDINGHAALNACLKIKEDLQKLAKEVLKRPQGLRGKVVAGSGTADEINILHTKNFKNIKFEKGFVFHSKDPNKKISFKDLLLEAYLNRIPLTYQGFYKYPEIHFDKETGKGNPFFYYTNGVAVSEVSIDKYTGEQKLLKTDIYMDLGRPINEGIDKGQVMGAFIQGLGWVTTENLHYNEKGRLLSISPSTYKIPSVHDIPREFNCNLIENNLNFRNVKGSKAVGEPPLLLAVSVWTAIKNALYNYKKSTLELSIPATQERIFNLINKD